MRNAARWGRVWGFVKFVIIVGPLVWAYFYFQPFLNQIGTMYSQLQGIQGATQTQNKDLQDALKNIKQMDFKQFDLKSLNPDQIQNKK